MPQNPILLDRHNTSGRALDPVARLVLALDSVRERSRDWIGSPRLSSIQQPEFLASIETSCFIASLRFDGFTGSMTDVPLNVIELRLRFSYRPAGSSEFEDSSQPKKSSQSTEFLDLAAYSTDQ